MNPPSALSTSDRCLKEATPLINSWADTSDKRLGSHYGVRTTALKEIGGLGAELAEDHTTT